MSEGLCIMLVLFVDYPVGSSHAKIFWATFKC